MWLGFEAFNKYNEMVSKDSKAATTPRALVANATGHTYTLKIGIESAISKNGDIEAVKK